MPKIFSLFIGSVRFCQPLGFSRHSCLISKPLSPTVNCGPLKQLDRPERKLTSIGARAVGVRAYVRLPDLRLGLRRHIRGEIDSDRLSAWINPNQPLKHLSRSHSHL